MASDRTKQARVLQIIFFTIHILCLIGPFVYYLPAAFILGEVVQKISLGLTVILAIVLAAISFIVDVTHRAGLHRTILWLLIIGIMTCLARVQTFIWIMAITSILDELIFSRLANKYKTIKNTNKEIDKALNR